MRTRLFPLPRKPRFLRQYRGRHYRTAILRYISESRLPGERAVRSSSCARATRFRTGRARDPSAVTQQISHRSSPRTHGGPVTLAREVWRLKSREFSRIAFKRLKIFNAFKEPCAKRY
jgi:hypothetical protein